MILRYVPENAIGNRERIPADVNTGLEQHGIQTVNSISRRKNAADLVIVTEEMRMSIFIESHAFFL